MFCETFIMSLFKSQSVNARLTTYFEQQSNLESNVDDHTL